MFNRLRGDSRKNVVNMRGVFVEKKRPSEYVFTFQGKPIFDVKTSVRKACTEAGIPYGRKMSKAFTFHDLRHTFASYSVMKNVPLKTVQALLGHNNITMTMRYYHLADGVKVEAVNALNGIASLESHKTVTNEEPAQRATL